MNVNTSGMTACQRIMAKIVSDVVEGNTQAVWNENLTSENVVDAWRLLTDHGWLRYAVSAFRCSGLETKLDCDYSPLYESKAVANQLADGTWIGWTYWHGGGRFGNPESVEWLQTAYFVDCESVEKVITVRTFKKASAAA